MGTKALQRAHVPETIIFECDAIELMEQQDYLPKSHTMRDGVVDKEALYQEERLRVSIPYSNLFEKYDQRERKDSDTIRRDSTRSRKEQSEDSRPEVDQLMLGY